MCRRCICRKCPASIRVAERRRSRGIGRSAGVAANSMWTRWWCWTCTGWSTPAITSIATIASRAATPATSCRISSGHALRLPWRSRTGRRIAECANAAGVGTRAHEIGSLELEYGTLVPMRYMNGDDRARWCRWLPGAWHTLEDSRRRRRAAPGDRAERQPWRCWPAARCRIASTTMAAAKPPCTRSAGSSSGRWTCAWWICGARATGRPLRHAAGIRGPVWARAACTIPPCAGPAGLGCYDQPAEIVTEYFASSGTGQLNAVFPVPA